jgi:hypothetical protein
MADVKPGLSPGVVRMRFTRHGTAHLAGEAIAVENLGAKLFGYPALERRSRLRVFKKILPLFQVRPVIVGEDLKSLFVAELANAACPLRDAARDFAGGSLQLSSTSAQGSHSVTGAVFADGELRITTIDEFPVNVAPSRHMLIARHRDMPGIIGQLGSVLGEHNVNIASMQVGRRIVRGDAVMVVSLDDPIPASLLATINAINGIQQAHTVTF